MTRALFVCGRKEPASFRTAVFALALVLAGLWALSVAARAETGTRGQDENGGREVRALASANTVEQGAAAIVIASARTGAGGSKREMRAFTLAEVPGRDTRDMRDARDAPNARGAEATDQSGGEGGTSAPGVPRSVLDIPQVITGLVGGISRRGEGQEAEAWTALAFREIGHELAPLGFEHGPSGPPPVALSVFMGHKNGDVFSSLHEEYAWRMKFKSMTLGLGFYREIVVGERARILPYVGVIRSSLSLRPAGLASEQLLHEYQLTVLCFGLPLVIGF
jgi:hypothetical protein